MLDDEELRSFIDAGDAEGQPYREGGSKRASAVLSNSLSNRLTTYQKMMLLNLVALIWGSQHAVMKGLVTSSASPSTVNACRFALAAGCTARWLPCCTLTKRRGLVLRNGIVLGLLLFVGFATYSTGLQYTTAARSGFLLYLNVKFVPLFAYCFMGRRMSATAWAMAATAVAGTLLLCNDGSPPNIGDLWSVASAVTSAIYILRLESSAKTGEAEVLNAVTQASVAVLSALWAAWDIYAESYAVGPRSPTDRAIEQLASIRPHWVEMCYLGIFCTAVCGWLQNIGQDGVPAEKASLIYAMDPVYGAVFSRILMGEKLGALGLFGAGLVTFAAAIAAWDQMRQERRASAVT